MTAPAVQEGVADAPRIGREADVAVLEQKARVVEPGQQRRYRLASGTGNDARGASARRRGAGCSPAGS